MIIIKGTTKKGKNMIESAKYYHGYNIYDVYEKPSFNKIKAYDFCKNQCFCEGGKDFRIISHNTFSFSVAWFVDTGVRIETANNSYFVLYPEFCR